MNSRKETERTKYIQEKCQTLLTQMLRDEDNKYCVDCDAKGPRWASWNIGVFLCIRCAGIHRNLGVHISKVKSVNLDTWTPEQVVSLQQMGNSRARAVYEAQLPDGFRRPQNDSALESFIRAKYEHKKYLAREWVPPPAPKVDWNKEIDEEIERQKRKKKSASGTTSLNLSSPAGDKKTSTIKTPLPAPLPKPKNSSNSPKSLRNEIIQVNNNASSDLLGLSTPVSTSIPTTSSQTQQVLDNDVFTSFLSAPIDSPASDSKVATKKETELNLVDNLAKQEADFFNQTVPNEKEKAKLTKDSILALYATTPKPNPMGFNTFNGATAGGFPTQMQQMPQNQFVGMPQQYPGTMLAGANQFVGHQPNLSGLHLTNQMPSMQQSFMTQNPNIPIIPQQNMFNMSQPMMTGQMNPVSFPAQQTQIPPNQQQFAQFPSVSNFSQPAANQSNLNQQFGNMSLGNVWQ